MAKPKVHLETGRFGKAACGKDHVDVTKDPTLVTCKGCRRADVFAKWWIESTGVVGNPDQG